MYNTAKLSRLASTKAGMRTILKSRLPPVDYIKWAVQTGIYKSIYYPDTNSNSTNSNGPNDNRHNRNAGGGGGDDQAHHRMPKINPYPEEYEILTLNPPLPMRPRLSKKDYRYLQMEMKLKEQHEKEKGEKQTGLNLKKVLPTTDKLVKKYMQRYDNRMKSISQLTDTQREDEYYQNILGISERKNNDFNSAMGRKSSVLNHAYEFALKQYQVLSDSHRNDQVLSEEDSIQIVEQLLAQEEKDERLQSRMKAQKVVKNAKEKQKEGEEAVGSKEKEDGGPTSSSSPSPPSATIPSILYSKPRTIQALHIWGQRLQAVPYNQWSLGATTALDHWIAVDVLGMKEETWNRLLNGELEIDIQESYGGGLSDVLIGDKARMNDIVTVRETMFPETVIHSLDDDEEVMEMKDEFGDAENALKSVDDDNKVGESNKDDTERSIDELLASLGGFEDEDDDEEEDNVEEMTGLLSNDNDNLDTRIAQMVDSLQDWRQKNMEKPYEKWDDSSKKDFNVSDTNCMLVIYIVPQKACCSINICHDFLMVHIFPLFTLPNTMILYFRNGSLIIYL